MYENAINEDQIKSLNITPCPLNNIDTIIKNPVSTLIISIDNISKINVNIVSVNGNIVIYNQQYSNFMLNLMMIPTFIKTLYSKKNIQFINFMSYRENLIEDYNKLLLELMTYIKDKKFQPKIDKILPINDLKRAIYMKKEGIIFKICDKIIKQISF